MKLAFALPLAYSWSLLEILTQPLVTWARDQAKPWFGLGLPLIVAEQWTKNKTVVRNFSHHGIFGYALDESQPPKPKEHTV